jgi:hypothetical protein
MTHTGAGRFAALQKIDLEQALAARHGDCL